MTRPKNACVEDSLETSYLEVCFHVGKTAGVTDVLNSAFILGDH